MNKQQLTQVIASLNPDLTKTAVEKVITDTFEIIKCKVIGGDEVKVMGFATFTRFKAKGRVGRNPQTGKMIKINSQWRAKARFHEDFKNQINNEKARKLWGSHDRVTT